MFGPLLIEQFELHRRRYVPEIKAGTRLRSKLGFLYRVESVDGEKVVLKRLGVRRGGRGAMMRTVWPTTMAAVRERLVVVR